MVQFCMQARGPKVFEQFHEEASHGVFALNAATTDRKMFDVMDGLAKLLTRVNEIPVED